MIPLRLKLQNFLSYGESVDALDFTEFKLACLTGKNGHGKSAILDAITWAVWGEARKADFSRTPDSDLLRLSADEMTVEFSFVLNGFIYTVDRGFKRGKKTGKSTLEFSVQEDHDSQPRLLTGSSKKETQARIIETVGLDYRTFVNSSFLKQGKSDEFTRQSPKDRKEILTNILGLSFYDQMLDECKLQLNACKAEEQNVLQRMGGIEEELKEEDSILAKESELKDSLSEKEKVLNEILQRETKSQEELNKLGLEKDRVDSWKREVESSQQRLQEYTARSNRLHDNKQEMSQLIERVDEIEARHKRYEEIHQQLNQFIETESQWKQLEKQKSAIEKVIETKRSSLREQLAGLQSEEKQIIQSKNECTAWIDKEAEIESAHQAYQTLIRDENAYTKSKPAFDQLQKSIQDAEAKINLDLQQLQTKKAELKGQTQALPKLETEINTTKKRLEELQSLEKQHAELDTKLKAIIEQGQEARSNLNLLANTLEQTKQKLHDTKEFAALIESGSTDACPVCKQPLQEHAQGELKQHYQDEEKLLNAEIQSIEKKQTVAKTELERVGAEYKSQENQLKELHSKISSYEAERDSLPQKEQELKRLQSLQQILNGIEQQINDNQFALPIREQLMGYQQELQQLDYSPEHHTALQKQIHEQRQAESDWQTLQEKKQQGLKLEERLKLVTAEISDLQNTIENQRFCSEERNEIKQIEEKIIPLQKELEKRETLQKEQNSLQNVLVEFNQLKEAKAKLPDVIQELDELQAKTKQLQEQLQETQEKIGNAAKLIEQYEEQRAAYEKIQTERKGVETERNALYQEMGSVQARKEALEKRKEETVTLREQLDVVAKEIRYCEILRRAFSRDGIPAMMVEQALPELEEDANRLLRRLTHGSCTVKFQTQRESKTGSMKETLDILISDEMGTRDYDMFSGGEAFRTDLAVRIALSQLLCRRAGSRLQLLVIDEGFGTQDAEGLSNIVDAIDEIQDEFEKVLVVTHIEELKERFKDRIEVIKDPGIGSRFQVVHAL